ncbi:hypothetical protein GCM10023213_43010 [Prosthecobacter algae]|uniref:Lipoprotein n=1 Tax=Prosthecobacter algae TaxID=1144682 RepID=A0ABP9PJW2_9BACT
MKSIVYLTLAAILALVVPSCSTHVNAGGGASVNRGKAKHSHHHQRSDTRVKANVGASVGL